MLDRRDLKEFARACGTGFPVRIVYESSDGATTERTVSPRYVTDNLRVMRGFCQLRGESRAFRTAQITHWEIADTDDPAVQTLAGRMGFPTQNVLTALEQIVRANGAVEVSFLDGAFTVAICKGARARTFSGERIESAARLGLGDRYTPREPDESSTSLERLVERVSRLEVTPDATRFRVAVVTGAHARTFGEATVEGAATRAESRLFGEPVAPVASFS